MSLKIRIILAILTCACVSVMVVAAPLYLGTQQLIGDASSRELAQARATVRNGLDSRIATALSMARTIAAIPRVQRAVEGADTKGLHRLFVKDFAELSASTGVAQFQFHTPDAVSILRVHDPDRHGDDLSAIRPMVVQANRDRVALAGIENGPAGIGIRGIAPVTDDGEHLGTVEIGLRFDSLLFDGILQDSSIRLEVYSLTEQEGDASMTRITGNYTGEALLARELVRAMSEDPDQVVQMEIEGQRYAGTGFPIKDFSGNPVALAHVLLPQGSVAAISEKMAMLALGAAALAVIFSAIMAVMLGKRLTAALHRVADRMRALAAGQTDLDFEDLRGQSEIGQMAEALVVFRDEQIAAEQLRSAQSEQQEAQAALVADLAKALRGLADGALDTRINRDFGEAYEELVKDFNAAASGLNDLISAIAGVAGTVTDRAKDLSEAAVDLSNRTETSAATLEETAAALEQVTSNLRTTTEGAQSANAAGISAINKARSGAEVVSETVNAMTAIDDSAGEIARITDLIDDIAFQTNLLALNAGVEAARAGSAGSGFAVVASEVQALARRTADAAGQIGSLISASGEKVKHGVLLVNRTGAALDEIVAAVDVVTKQISTIAELALEQRQSLSEINVAITDLDQTTQKNAAMFQETNAVNEALLEQGEKLKTLVERFRYGHEILLFDEADAA